MTITSTLTSSGPYTAAAQTTFPVAFQSASDTEIRVTLDDVDVSPAAYVFNRDEDGTGDVVFNNAVTGEVIIYSEPEFIQPIEFLTFGAFYPSQMNLPLDKAAIRDLYLLNKIGTTVGPAGPAGPQGPTGTIGATGATGATGAAGAAAANPNYSYAINTLAPGSSATLTPSGSYPDITLTFGIPRGDPGASGALGDGTYAGIVVSGSGSALNVVAGHITLARMANLAQNTIIGRVSAGTGVPEALSAANVKTILALVKGDVGLGNVDNTSDANKPVSTAQQTALDLKVSAASPALTGNPTAPTQSQGDASTKLATTAFVDRLLDLPLIRATASPSAVLTDRGGVVEATTSAALPANSSIAFGIGSLVVFYNDSGVGIPLTITTDTLRLAGTTSTGARTISPRGYAYCRKRATTEWTVSGDVT